jgi:hypothetical protein
MTCIACLGGGGNLRRLSMPPIILAVNKARRGVGNCGLRRQVCQQPSTKLGITQIQLTWPHYRDENFVTNLLPNWRQGKNHGLP